MRYKYTTVVRRRVQKIIDGDTFFVKKKVAGSQFIRIAGFNAPEKGQRGYAQATKCLSKKIGGKVVTIKPVGKSYGRTVAKVPFAKYSKK